MQVGRFRYEPKGGKDGLIKLRDYLILIEDQNFENNRKGKTNLGRRNGGGSQEVSVTEYMDLVTEERKRSTGFGAKG